MSVILSCRGGLLRVCSSIASVYNTLELLFECVIIDANRPRIVSDFGKGN